MTTPPWLCGAGETRAIARRLDWTATSLGPRDVWPASLHTVIDIVLAAETPMAVFWGADYVMIYNDRCAQLLGACHPKAFGQPAARRLARSWAGLEPLLRRVRRTRVGHNARITIAAADHGAYVVAIDVTYVPIHDGSDRVVGILAVAREVQRAELAASEAPPVARGSSVDIRTRR